MGKTNKIQPQGVLKFYGPPKPRTNNEPPVVLTIEDSSDDDEKSSVKAQKRDDSSIEAQKRDDSHDIELLKGKQEFLKFLEEGMEIGNVMHFGVVDEATGIMYRIKDPIAMRKNGTYSDDEPKTSMVGCKII